MGRIVVLIPARGGSKSIPLKNIKQFCGKPLLYWTVKASVDCKQVDEVVVATDDQQIKDTVLGFKLDKTSVYDRDPANAQDTSSTEDLVSEYIKQSDLKADDLLVLVQATSPTTSSKHIGEAINKYKAEKLDSLLTAARMKRFFWEDDGTPINYDYTKRPRRQDFRGTFIENGAFYIFSVSGFQSDLNRLHGKIGIYEMPEYSTIEIDEPDDWIMAESIMKKYVLSKEDKPTIKVFLTDVDGTLTDAGMYYDQQGNELKKFNTQDGKGFELLRKAGVKTGIITSENTKIVENRAKKVKADYLYQGAEHGAKLEIAKLICENENISLAEVAYIGDDINCKELLECVGIAACPSNALPEIKAIPGINRLSKEGGQGVVREFVSLLFERGCVEGSL